MPDDQEIASKKNRALSAEDYIILTVIIIGLLGPIVMFGTWQAYGIYFPPTLIAVFLGIAVAALLYRFLGGVHDATFAVGALKVTGSAAVLAGVAWWSNGELQEQMEVYDTQKQMKVCDTQKKRIESRCEGQLKDSDDRLVAVAAERSELAEEVKQYKKNTDLVDRIEKLEPDRDVSAQIRQIALSKKGPWSPVSSTRSLRVSVAGYLKTGQIASCPEYFDKTLEIVSEYQYAGEYMRGSSAIIVTVNRYISRAPDCDSKRDFQLQLNCQDAESIFTSTVLECSDDGVPKWKVTDRKLPVSAVLVVDHGP